jgi:hypothetical protein
MSLRLLNMKKDRANSSETFILNCTIYTTQYLHTENSGTILHN